MDRDKTNNLDLEKLEQKLDEALSNETSETLTKFLTDKRMSNNKQSMKLYTEKDLIDLVESLKDYTHEAHSILGHDERDAKEFVDIFLKDRTPIELPSDEEIQDESEKHYDNNAAKAHDYYFELGAKWMRNKIQGGNK